MKKYLKLAVALLLVLPFSAKAWIASDIQALIKDKELLLKQSSRDFITVEEGKYVVFAHGYASLDGGFEKSRIAATADSLKQIAKLLGSSSISTDSSFEYASKGDTEIRKTLNCDQIDVSMFIRNAQTRGYWIDEGLHIISCIYLNLSPSVERGVLTEEFYDINLGKAEIDILENNRDIWLGGVKIIYNAKDNNHYLIALVSVEENKAEHLLERLLISFAMKESLIYLNGVDFENKSILTTEMQSISIGESNDVEMSESFKDINIAKAKGAIKSLEKLGTLKHKISKRKYALFIKKLENL